MITARNFWFWFGGTWLGVGLVFVVVAFAAGVSRANFDARLLEQGARTQGIVLSKEIVSSEDSATEYRVDFRFSTAAGDTVRGRAPLNAAAWDAVVERGPIEVDYLPDSPDRHRVGGERDSGFFLVFAFGAIGSVLVLVGSFVIATALRNRRRNRDLEREGVVAAATVVDVGPGHLRINGMPQWELRYRYVDGQGRSHDGSCNLSAQDAQCWQQGARGRVRYDRSNPRSHVWVGDAS